MKISGIFERGERWFARQMTIVDVVESGQGVRIAVCEWVEAGKLMTVRVAEEELALYFPRARK